MVTGVEGASTVCDSNGPHVPPLLSVYDTTYVPRACEHPEATGSGQVSAAAPSFDDAHPTANIKR
jgi:hypothetical protein